MSTSVRSSITLSITDFPQSSDLSDFHLDHSKGWGHSLTMIINPEGFLLLFYPARGEHWCVTEICPGKTAILEVRRQFPQGV